MKPISHLRKDYALQQLLEKDINKNPMLQFEKWWDEAVQAEVSEVNAMTLSTINLSTMSPNARIVLLKAFNYEGFTFYSNYASIKGQELQSNPKACLSFFWKELERQVRIQGDIKKLSEDESETYFNSRPYESRIAAWASAQSTIIKNRNELDENYKKYSQQFPLIVPKPPQWGGYIVNPETIEFWQGRKSRLHDRIVYEKHNHNWHIHRISP